MKAHLLPILSLKFMASFGHADDSAEIAAVEALGTMSSTQNAPAIFTDDVIPGTPATLNPDPSGDVTQTIYYNALDHENNATRVFAWVGIPKEASAAAPAPGIVLVHGGGGTAFKTWVNKWVDQGFVAISIAVEGQTDVDSDPITQGNQWTVHNMPGPAREGIYGDDHITPITDQWMYHATADAIIANSLLRSLNFVDSNKVGIMGVSWGGIITSTTIGIDNRFAFAIPTYGCGHLFDSANAYEFALKNNDLYKNVWDPYLRLSNATMPTLWFSWPQDEHFPMHSFAYCYHKVGGSHMTSLIPGLRHSHGAAWNNPASYAFAKSIVNTSTPWCLQQNSSVAGSNVTITFDSTKTLNSATLVYTLDHDDTVLSYNPNQIWNELPLSAPTESPAGIWTTTATLPAGTRGWIINVTDPAGVISSSDYHEVVQINLNPSPELSINHDLADAQSNGTVNVSYTSPSNVTIVDINITAQSHAVAFSTSTVAPILMFNDEPVTTPIDITFDNTIAGLTSGQTATATLNVVTENIDGTTTTTSLPLKATATLIVPQTITYSSDQSWSSQAVNCTDTVIINNDATVTMDSPTACLSDLIINNSASPTSGTLVIAQPTMITVENAITMGTTTGPGYLNQSDGTITTPLLTINPSNTGDGSIYTMTGGTLSLTDSGFLDVRAGSSFILDGGTVSKDLSPLPLTPPGNSIGTHLASGKIQIQSGSFQYTGGVPQKVINNYGEFEISGGDLDIIAQLRNWGTFKVIGDDADIVFNNLGTFAGSLFSFEFDETGVSPIKTNSWFSLQNATTAIDGSAYLDGAGRHTLFSGGNLNTLLNTAAVSYTGFADKGLTPSIEQNQTTHLVELVLTNNAYGTWISGNAVTGADALTTANSDGDSHNNLYEYAFGGDPTIDQDLPIPFTFDGTSLTIDRRAATAAGLTYTLEESTTLETNDWDPVINISENVTATNGDFETVAITKTTGSWSSDDEFFLRFKVEYTP